MNLKEIYDLIDRDLEKAFLVLDELFKDKPPLYRDLLHEYISPPNNFSISLYRSKLKRFVFLHEKGLQRDLVYRSLNSVTNKNNVSLVNVIKDAHYQKAQTTS